jgi:hypothetical protein
LGVPASQHAPDLLRSSGLPASVPRRPLGQKPPDARDRIVKSGRSDRAAVAEPREGSQRRQGDTAAVARDRRAAHRGNRTARHFPQQEGRASAHLRIAAKPKNAPPEVTALLDVVRAAQAEGGKIKDVVKLAEKAFGPACMQFSLKFIVPALIARGLLLKKKFLFTHFFA